MKRSINNLYVSEKPGRFPSEKPGRLDHFSRVPDSVLLDRGIGASAVRVFALLAGRTRGCRGTAVCGIRLIARLLGMTKDTVSSALTDLEQAGHIRARSEGKQRRSYTLTSPIFRREWTAEAAGEVVRYSQDDPDGPVYKQIVRARKAG